jgi:hypothetical protein
MNRLDDGVRRRREKAVHQMRTGDRLRLRAAIAVEFSPDARKTKQRAAFIERKPDHVLFLGLRVWPGRILGEAIGGHQAAVLGVIRL